METLNHSARRHSLPLRVYWEDTDAGGIVFYANYLRYFERARTEWLRRLGFGQQDLKVNNGLMFVVSRVDVRYLAPARLDDLLDIHVDLQEPGRASLHVQQQAWRGDQLLCEARVELACVDSQSLRPRRIPAPILDTFAS